MRPNPASQTIIRRLSQCSSRAEIEALPTIFRIQLFPVKSGKTAPSACPPCLTAGLPDVRTGKAFHRKMIRWAWNGGPARDLLRLPAGDAFKAPSFRYSVQAL